MLEIETMFVGRDPAHDFTHVMRVYNAAKRIGREEQNVDTEILLAAALLHDIIVYPKGSEKSSKSAEESAVIAEKMLAAHGLSKDRIDKVSYCIRTHSFSNKIKPETIEAKILQDADRLDALGAIGVARTFSVGGTEMRRFYNPRDPFCKTGREPEDTRWTVDHFKTKLLKLEETMNTQGAKKIARDRTRFMEEFLAQMEKETNYI